MYTKLTSIILQQLWSYSPGMAAVERTVNMLEIPAYNDTVHSRFLHECRYTVTRLTSVWKETNEWIEFSVSSMLLYQILKLHFNWISRHFIVKDIRIFSDSFHQFMFITDKCSIPFNKIARNFKVKNDTYDFFFICIDSIF